MPQNALWQANDDLTSLSTKVWHLKFRFFARFYLNFSQVGLKFHHVTILLKWRITQGVSRRLKRVDWQLLKISFRHRRHNFDLEFKNSITTFVMLRVIGRTSPFLTETVLRKTLSLSACSPKRFVIKDHFDFDKKVINKKWEKKRWKSLKQCGWETHRPYMLQLQVINADNAVVVNFHAEWCEPCKILTPKMTELLEDNPEIDLAVVDVDTNIE